MAGFDERGALVDVELQDGLLKMTVPLPGAGPKELQESAWKDLALQAPRPALHLLRQADLDKAFLDLGERMFTDAVFVRNERIARELGGRWTKEMLQRCEDGTSEPGQPKIDETVQLKGEVLWCDTDRVTAGLLEVEGLTVCCFRTPEQLLQVFRRRRRHVVGILTSMMERGGRKERGEMNAFDLFTAVIKIAQEDSSPQTPILGLISLSAERDTAVAAGADFVVYGDRFRAQQQMLRWLRQKLEPWPTLCSDMKRPFFRSYNLTFAVQVFHDCR
ncbi:unnamed protein product [Durusdinium trenchii]|uniref:Uncharacterized protein n=1 Tax=Durusdinium trenchii TaxID=1381693 RepID=A0ABP0LPI5_9DINO